MAGADDPVRDAVVRETARANDIDRYLAALLAPRNARRDLIALAAFMGEMARIAGVVSEPIVGEIRLQWWRDALDGTREGVSTGSPVADVLGQAIARHGLPQDLFLTIIDARSRNLERSQAGEKDLDAFLRDTEGAAFRLAAHMLGVAASPQVEELLAAAAQAYGRVCLLRSLPLPAGLKRAPALTMRPPQFVMEEARSWLEQARRRAAAAPAGVLPAILPVALVEPYLAALEKVGPDIARTRAEISPLTRVWRLWRVSARGRL